MGIPTLIADNSSDTTDLTSIDFTSGIDSTYDEYMFVCTDIGPATDGATFHFQFNASGGSGFNETITSTFFNAFHQEDDGEISFTYATGGDQAQYDAYQQFAYAPGSAADESVAGILHLFNPSSTTYVKHFYGRNSEASSLTRSYDNFVAGYINTTAAIDEISFKMSTGNMDGLIQMYGIS